MNALAERSRASVVLLRLQLMPVSEEEDDSPTRLFLLLATPEFSAAAGSAMVTNTRRELFTIILYDDKRRRDRSWLLLIVFCGSCGSWIFPFAILDLSDAIFRFFLIQYLSHSTAVLPAYE